MKLFKLSIIFLFTLSIFSCSDEEIICTQADWIGSYTGIATCDGVTDQATVTITASGTDAIIIQYAITNGSTLYTPLMVDGCTIDTTNTTGGVTASVNATLDGDDFSLEDTASGGGFNTNCIVTATRD